MEKEVIWFGVHTLTTLAPNILVLGVLRFLENPPGPGQPHPTPGCAISPHNP